VRAKKRESQKGATPIPNKHRGEIEGLLDGVAYRLCLTLGALADLESAFGDENMLALAQRFEGGRLSARDCVRIIGAGLRGAGNDISDSQVAQMQAEGGIAGFVDIVARLLTITFAPPPILGSTNTPPPTSLPTPSEVAEPRPFPGTK
jgi:Phage tail tube protein, GTA-gp10